MKHSSIPAIDTEGNTPGSGRGLAEKRGAHALLDSLPTIDVSDNAPSVDVASTGSADIPEKKRPFSVKIAVAAACALALVGAGVAIAVAGGQLAVPEKKAPTPTTLQATVKADGVLVVGPTMQRGDTLTNVVDATELTGAYAGGYYRAMFNGQTVYIAKDAVRTSEETAPEQWTGYATADAIIYAKPDFSGDNILTLQFNEEVTVLDSFADKLFVRNADGFEGYMPADKISRERNPEPQRVAPTTSSSSSSAKKPSSGSSSSKAPSPSGSSNSGSSGSNSSGGNSDGGSSNGSTSGGAGGESVDGGEINIGDLGLASPSAASMGLRLLSVEKAYADEPKQGEQTTNADSAEGEAAAKEGITATVLVDGTQTYLTLLNRGDAVTVKVDGQFGFTDRTLQEGAELPVFEGDQNSEDEAASENVNEGAAPEQASAEDNGELTQDISDEERDLAASEAPSEDLCTVILNDQEAMLPESLLTLETETPYAAWDGFATEGATLYANYQLTAGAMALEVNAPVKIIDAIGSTLVVQTENGIFYLAENHASKEQVEVAKEEVTEQSASTSSSSVKKPSSTSPKKPSSSSSSSDSSGSTNSSSNSGSSDSGSSSGAGSSGANSGSGSSSDNSSTDEDTSTGASEDGPLIL